MKNGQRLNLLHFHFRYKLFTLITFKLVTSNSQGHSGRTFYSHYLEFIMQYFDCCHYLTAVVWFLISGPMVSRDVMVSCDNWRSIWCNVDQLAWLLWCSWDLFLMYSITTEMFRILFFNRPPQAVGSWKKT